MALELNGTTGVSLVQDGVITDANLPEGSVLQVVHASTSTTVIVSTSTFTDTGLSASITPTSSTSTILVIVNQSAYHDRDAGSQYSGINLLRDSTVIFESVSDGGPYDYGSTGSSQLFYRASIFYEDSPSTTSSITYKTQGRPYSTSSNGSVIFQANGSVVNGTSTITLMEIAG